MKPYFVYILKFYLPTLCLWLHSLFASPDHFRVFTSDIPLLLFTSLCQGQANVINHLAPPRYPVYKVLLVIGLAVHNLIAASMPLPSCVQRSSHNHFDESDIIPYVRKAGAF